MKIGSELRLVTSVEPESSADRINEAMSLAYHSRKCPPDILLLAMKEGLSQNINYKLVLHFAKII